ncbi:uncharacterized protein [Miscanthus floridulus]|uniref:uncharacterized protein n=1 Tax=Miscanthus floridulus TaxID=154761 RepID=UPI003459A249
MGMATPDQDRLLLDALPSTPERKISSMFSSSITVEIGNGASTQFWTDAWLPTAAIPTFAPNLFKAVGRRRLGRSVKDALTDRRWVCDITGAHTALVLYEYVQLWARLKTFSYGLWNLIASSGAGQLMVSTPYVQRTGLALWAGRAWRGPRNFWHAAVPPKVKFFFWIALHGRLWTAERRKRRGLQLDVACALCDQLDETTDHLICSCVYAREVWSCLLHSLGSLATAPQQDSSLLDWWLLGRATLPQALRRSFDSLVLPVSWCLWKERNRRTFDHRSLMPPELLCCILDEANAWIGAGYGCLALLTASAA